MKTILKAIDWFDRHKMAAFAILAAITLAMVAVEAAIEYEDIVYEHMIKTHYHG